MVGAQIRFSTGEEDIVAASECVCVFLLPASQFVILAFA